MLYNLGERKVELRGDNHFIADNATLVGSVIVENDASIWFNVVIRGDCDLIHIGEGSNIQDGSVLHTDTGIPLKIGKGVTVGHKAMLHGCEIGDNSLIGINAVVLNGVKIGKNCIIGANALVLENTDIPDNSLVVGSPALIKTRLGEDAEQALKHSAEHYIENGKRFNKELVPANNS
ncbi:MAG: gamma carbonic anhydrase family protein [Candidatus Pelagadaptatus aseana]|uniref:gamma carbonic anhydrase family protein n=1 Tax=Candidatus Pelagadaptatus aseana TaxID=3120508 RepID=UPI0039B2D18D